MPFASFNPTNLRTNPLNFHKKISRIGDFENLSFFESAILDFFLLHSHENQSKFLEWQEWVEILMITLVSSCFLPLKSSNRAYYNSKKQDVHGYIGFWAVMHQIPLVYYYPFCTFPRLNWNLQRLTKCNGIAFFHYSILMYKWQADDVCLKPNYFKKQSSSSSFLIT